MRDRERQHRAERVQVPQERGLARDERDARHQAEQDDPDPRRAVPRVQPAQPVGQLAVQPHRVHQARHADDPGVGRDEQDRRGQQADVDLARVLQRPQVQRLDHAEDRVPGEAALLLGDAELRHVLAVGLLGDRQGGQRDRGQGRVDREHGDHHAVDRARDRPLLVARLLGHVRDRLDPGVGDHPDRDRDQEVVPGRGNAERHVVDQRLGREHQDRADQHEQHLGHEVRDGERDVEPGGLLDPDDVDHAQHGDHADAEDDVAGRAAQVVPEEPADVVRHEERRDGDRDRVVEHLAPGGEERPELVEGVPRERGGAAGLGVHGGGLGVGRGRQVEDHAGDQEDHRRQAEGEGRDQAERVVDRRADVAVGRREQRVDPQHALEALEAAFGHGAGV